MSTIERTATWRLPVFTLSCVLSACGRSDLRETREDASITSAATRSAGPISSATASTAAPEDVAEPPLDVQRTLSGVAMKELKRGLGDSDVPAPDDCVRARFTGWRRDGTFALSSGGPEEDAALCLRRTWAGVADALRTMHIGDRKRIWVPASLTMGDRSDGSGTRGALTLDIELTAITRAPLVPEDLRLPPSSATRKASGLSVRHLKKGSGTRRPSLSSWVVLHMTGWAPDGTLRETTRMDGHAAAYNMRDLMPGWREALGEMVVGDEVRIWVPAALGYGPQPGRRPAPAEAMVYELELREIE